MNVFFAFSQRTTSVKLLRSLLVTSTSLGTRRSLGCSLAKPLKIKVFVSNSSHLTISRIPPTGKHAVAIAMRDVDCGMRTVLLVRSDAHLTDFKQLKGKRIGFGASDSPQARLLPKYFLETHVTSIHSTCGIF